jgi:Protein of unknown function (DUF2628)
MALYTIHAPRKADGAAASPAELVFVKEGFCWPALIIPLIWTLYRRLWLMVLLLLAAVFLLVLLREAGGAVASVVYLLGRILYGLEANGLRRWTLERNGHTLVGVVEGRNVEEAERRFFTEWHADAPDADLTPRNPGSSPTAWAPAPWQPAAGEPEVVGLFPTPGSPR